MGTPETYVIIVVGAFQMLFSWVIYFNYDSRDVERYMNDKMLEKQERLYEKMIDMATPAVNKVNDSPKKSRLCSCQGWQCVPTIKRKEPRNEMVTNDGTGNQCINNPLQKNCRT